VNHIVIGSIIMKTVSDVSMSLHVTVARQGDLVDMFMEGERLVLSDAKEFYFIR